MSFRHRWALALSHLLAASSVAAQSASERASLDSLLSAPISAASKYEQSVASAPASVTLVTADDIRNHGYRNLSELLEGVTGLYASNDRNYPYLGVRGFSRPGDYNNRILLLVDGHTLNDQVWGQAPVGTDLAIPIDAIERVEVVRGPGSVLYGSSAMFGVINIVTRSATQLGGVRATATVGELGAREVSASAGTALGTRGAIAVSGMAMRRDGADLYFPEFDDAATSGGIAHGRDWEKGDGFLASLDFAALSLRAGYRSRSKGIATGSYQTIFDHPDARTRDVTFWQELGVERRQSGTLLLRGRAYHDHHTYRGGYPTDGDTAYGDAGVSSAAGADLMGVWDRTSSQRLTAGVEARRVYTASFTERFSDGSTISDDAPFTLLSAFAQHEMQLTRELTVVGGLRHDHISPTRRATTPRAGVIVTPNDRTTIKILYGQAFRAPSPSEADFATSYYAENPALRQERVITYEGQLQRRLHPALLGGVSLFRYDVSRLIDQVQVDPADPALFVNQASVHATGAELNLEARPMERVRGRASYAWQRVENAATGEWLTNSPRHIVLGSVTGDVTTWLRSTVDARRESGRRTVAGPLTPAFTRVDLNLLVAPRPLAGAELSLRVTNLLDQAYFSPGGIEHRQAMIEQDGRLASLKLTWRF